MTWLVRAGLVLCLSAGAGAAQQAERGTGAVMRALDKINGHIEDIQLRSGQTAAFGSIDITLTECRYPAGNPAGDAWAEIDVTQAGRTGKVFSGWMIASSPALSAMDHPRYDVWVMRCTTS